MSLPAHNPWPGLLPYGEEDAASFCGREPEIAALLDLVEGDTLSVLYGVSGLGKTSLVRAGLFPRLRGARFLPVYVRLDHDVEAWRTAFHEGWKKTAGDDDVPAPPAVPIHAPSLPNQVLTAFRRAAKAAGVSCPERTIGESLWEYFHLPEARFWTRDNYPLTPILVFDQFEEIFTLGQQTAERAHRVAALLGELSDLIQNRPSPRVTDAIERGVSLTFEPRAVPMRVVFTLREDFLPHLSQLRDRGFPTIRRRELRLEPLRTEAARRVIEEPAPEIVAAGLPDALLDFLGGASAGPGSSSGSSGLSASDPQPATAIEPALLSVVLHELFEKARAAGQERLTAELLTGSREAILDDFYARAFAGLEPALRAFVEDELLTPGGFRDNRALDDALTRPGITQAALDALVDRRLLRYEDRAQGQKRVELTHDLLCGVVRGAKRRRLEVGKLAAAEQAKNEAARKKREGWLRLARYYALPAIVGWAVAVGGSVDMWQGSAMQAFVVCFATLWLGILHAILVWPERGSAERWGAGVRALGVCLLQALLLGAVLWIFGKGLDGSLPWQIAAIVGAAWSGVGVGLVLRFFAATSTDALVSAGFAQFLILLTWGYIIPPSEMSPTFLRVASITPGYATQRVLDTSFLWGRELNGPLMMDHRQSYVNLDPEREMSVGDLFQNPKPALIGFLIQGLWGAAGFLCVGLGGRRAQKKPV